MAFPLRWLVAWLSAAVVFLGLDAIWLISTNSRVYRPVLGPILTPTPRFVPAGLFYVVYLTGVLVFAIRPAVKSRLRSEATRKGALFGFFAYATYDLTNQATLSVWSTRITALDLGWGTFVTAMAATAGYLAGARVSPRTPGEGFPPAR
jgi:uncharacterized membrane protein